MAGLLRATGIVGGLLIASLMAGCSGSSPGATTSTSPATGTTIPNAPPPTVLWDKDESLDRLTVNSAAEGATWDRIQAKVIGCTQLTGSGTVVYLGQAPTPFYGDDANTNGAGLNEPATAGTSCGAAKVQDVSASKETMVAGHRLNFCVGPSNLSQRAENVIVELWDKPSGQRILQHQFSNVAVCAS